ncbi:hypothetical protein ACEUAI_18695 [Aeromonas veronii]
MSLARQGGLSLPVVLTFAAFFMFGLIYAQRVTLAKQAEFRFQKSVTQADRLLSALDKFYQSECWKGDGVLPALSGVDTLYSMGYVTTQKWINPLNAGAGYSVSIDRSGDTAVMVVSTTYRDSMTAKRIAGLAKSKMSSSVSGSAVTFTRPTAGASSVDYWADVENDTFVSNPCR